MPLSRYYYLPDPSLARKLLQARDELFHLRDGDGVAEDRATFSR